jgi:hypothetical protein
MVANKYTAFKEILIRIQLSAKFLAISGIAIVGFTEWMFQIKS